MPPAPSPRMIVKRGEASPKTLPDDSSASWFSVRHSSIALQDESHTSWRLAMAAKRGRRETELAARGGAAAGGGAAMAYTPARRRSHDHRRHHDARDHAPHAALRNHRGAGEPRGSQ